MVLAMFYEVLAEAGDGGIRNRAHAVACYLEAGNIDAAKRLAEPLIPQRPSTPPLF
jgi:hypothetical protein